MLPRKKEKKRKSIKQVMTNEYVLPVVVNSELLASGLVNLLQSLLGVGLVVADSLADGERERHGDVG